MKPTVQAHRRWWLWTPLLALAVWLAFFGDKSPANDAVAVSLPVRKVAETGISGEAAKSALPAPAAITLVPRDTLLAAADTTPAASSPSRDLFSVRSWTPPPPPAVSAPAAPSAPPFPYTFIGKKQEGDAWEVYLTRSEQTFVARAGEILEGSYRIDSIQPPTLSVTYLPLGQVQTLGIGETR